MNQSLIYLKKKNFGAKNLMLIKHTLIPRPETELLVDDY